MANAIEIGLGILIGFGMIATGIVLGLIALYLLWKGK